MKFVKKKTFYSEPTYEFNLPAGHSCPFAKDCLVKVDRVTGKFNTIGKGFRCYASSAERFPAVRKMRWENYDDVLSGAEIIIPKDAKLVRIHSSGDFYSQEYFDRWIEVCKNNPTVKFWAFTKSIQYWVNRLSVIPSNLTIQASVGSYQDELIIKHNLKFAKVFKSKEEAMVTGLPIDTNDDLARDGDKSFALLDNFRYSKKEKLL